MHRRTITKEIRKFIAEALGKANQRSRNAAPFQVDATTSLQSDSGDVFEPNGPGISFTPTGSGIVLASWSAEFQAGGADGSFNINALIDSNSSPGVILDTVNGDRFPVSEAGFFVSGLTPGVPIQIRVVWSRIGGGIATILSSSQGNLVVQEIG